MTPQAENIAYNPSPDTARVDKVLRTPPKMALFRVLPELFRCGAHRYRVKP